LSAPLKGINTTIVVFHQLDTIWPRQWLDCLTAAESEIIRVKYEEGAQIKLFPEQNSPFRHNIAG